MLHTRHLSKITIWNIYCLCVEGVTNILFCLAKKTQHSVFSRRWINASWSCDSIHRWTGRQERRSRDTGSIVSQERASNCCKMYLGKNDNWLARWARGVSGDSLVYLGAGTEYCMSHVSSYATALPWLRHPFNQSRLNQWKRSDMARICVIRSTIHGARKHCASNEILINDIVTVTVTAGPYWS